MVTLQVCLLPATLASNQGTTAARVCVSHNECLVPLIKAPYRKCLRLPCGRPAGRELQV